MDSLATKNSPQNAGQHRRHAPAGQGQKPGAGRETFITIRGLTKYFGASPVYDDFNFNLPMANAISIFGPNGCGKSTLINMISGLLPMDAGEVLYDGQTIGETQISYVFQNYRE